jgi:hypothetical protein
VTKQIPACDLEAVSLLAVVRVNRYLRVGHEQPMAPFAPGISDTKGGQVHIARRPPGKQQKAKRKQRLQYTAKTARYLEVLRTKLNLMTFCLRT